MWRTLVSHPIGVKRISEPSAGYGGTTDAGVAAVDADDVRTKRQLAKWVGRDVRPVAAPKR